MKPSLPKSVKIISILFLIFLTCSKLFAVTNYVSKTGYHVSPFTSWANAATNIQAAVDVASFGDTVLVTNGTYYPADQIFITNNITVKSVNGAEKTIVNGGFPAQTNRCFYLDGANTIIGGFTITNGYIIGVDDGGGIYCYIGGTIQNCIISCNTGHRGGGVYYYKNCIVSNCTISGNSSPYFGGGVYCDEGGMVLNCIISKNSAQHIGGGVRCTIGAIVQNCTISGNSVTAFGGGIICLETSIIQNCTIYGNSANNSGGGVFLEEGNIVQNCTIYNNSANSGGGACFNTGGTIQNSILWNNFANSDINLNSGTINYSCSFPLPSGEGNISNNPQFVSISNFHLQATSPCRNAGTNLPYVYTTTDLDGNPRLIGDRVDMGTYEFVPEGGIVFSMLCSVFGIFFSMRKNVTVP